MYNRFPPFAGKFPLQKQYEKKAFLLVRRFSPISDDWS